MQTSTNGVLENSISRLIKIDQKQGARGAFHLPIRQAILCRGRIYASPTVGGNKPFVRQGEEERRRWAFFNSLQKVDNLTRGGLIENR
jgi:hypothetical protein